MFITMLCALLQNLNAFMPKIRLMSYDIIESTICARVLLNLLNLLRKSDKMRGNASLAFDVFSSTCFINLIIHEQSCKIHYVFSSG